LELQLARHAADLHDMAMQLNTAMVECKLLANKAFCKHSLSAKLQLTQHIDEVGQ
jgi:hypothetical protein